MKKIRRLITILLSAAMILSLAACGSSDGGQTTQAPETTAAESESQAAGDETAPEETGSEEEEGTLMAGAGSAAIEFPAEMFTEHYKDDAGNDQTSPLEGFSGEIESYPYARVLLIEGGQKTAIVTLELVNFPDGVLDQIKTLVSEKAELPEGNIWVHVNHTITTPHSSHKDDSVNEIFTATVLAAVEKAADDAVSSFQPAKLGVGEGTLDINTNRNVKAEDGNYYIGDECENTLEGSNKELTMIRLDSMDGEPIGMAISYGIKPTTIDNAEMSEGTRKISSDLTGLACTMMEDEFGCPVMFIMSASGDQEAKKTTNYFERGFDQRSNQETFVQKYQSVEYGIGLVKEYGQEMFDACSELAGSIECDQTSAAVRLGSTSFEYNNNNGEAAGNFDVSGLMIGDSLAFVGLKPEVDAVTEKALWDASPVEHTLLVSFLNGDGKYMPHASAYDEPKTVEGRKAGYAQGTAETFVDTAVGLIDNMANGIQSIKSIGFVDADGVKINAVAVEYPFEVNASSVSADAFAVNVFDVIKGTNLELGEGNQGQITKVYVNDAAETAEDGKDAGRFVIFEFNTDYQRGNVPRYGEAMCADVAQIGEIETADGRKIAGNGLVFANYTVTENANAGMGGQGGGPQGGGPMMSYTIKEGTYEITNIADFELHRIEDGTAFHAVNCTEEELEGFGSPQRVIDVDIPYALYIPEGYKEGGNYGLVLQIEDAGALGTDPMTTLTESQACANFASAEVQQMAKDAGMDGLFVLSPQCSMELRSTRDNYTISAFVPATWQLLDYITEEYDINMDRIFATGQSMGGMQVIDMAAQRDNYFAGIWEHGCQWGNAYNKEEPYTSRGTVMYYEMSKDATIWDKDDDGNDSDYGQNWLYLISDDNILISNCQGDLFSSTVWKEVKYLYEDIGKVEIPYVAFNPLEDSVDSMNEAIDKLVAADNKGFGFYWYAYTGGSHMLTWVYGHKLDAGYKWLVNQKREDETARPKIADMANEWAHETDPEKIAAKQTEDRAFTNHSGETVYFAVPAEGAGTKYYNSAWFAMKGDTVDDIHLPGWTPVIN